MPVDTFHNRNFVRKALTEIGRPGTETLLEMLDNSNFHKADLGRADSGEGSLVNHCLWVNRISADALEYARTRNSSIPESLGESLLVVCLLHRLGDVHFRTVNIPGSGPSKAITALERSGFRLTDAEKEVILQDGRTPEDASIDSREEAQVLSAIFNASRKNALDYALGIPVTEESLDPETMVPSYELSRVFMNENDHRLWADFSLPDFVSHDNPELEDFLEILTTCHVPLSISEDRESPDCLVACDENGAMAFLADYSEEEDGTHFFSSDRVCFGYCDLVFYLSRYPHYRPSYVLAQRTDGRWGAFSIKASNKKRIPLVDTVPMVKYEFRNRDAALRALKTKARYPVRVTNHLFYKEIRISDCFPSLNQAF